MIQRMSDQHKIKFLDQEKISKDIVKSESIPDKTIDQVAEEQKSKRLSNTDDGFMTSQHIFSARTMNITDEGGPSKYVKSESSNTIWDSNKTAEAAKELDSKTKTIQEKARIVSNRRATEDKRMNDLARFIKSTIQEKDSSVFSAGTLSGTNYKVKNNSMSIFDNKDFMRLQDKTGGEKISDDINTKKNQVDNSWRSGGKSVSSSDITSKLFDGLFNKEK